MVVLPFAVDGPFAFLLQSPHDLPADKRAPAQDDLAHVRSSSTCPATVNAAALSGWCTEPVNAWPVSSGAVVRHHPRRARKKKPPSVPRAQAYKAVGPRPTRRHRSRDLRNVAAPPTAARASCGLTVASTRIPRRLQTSRRVASPPPSKFAKVTGMMLFPVSFSEVSEDYLAPRARIS